MGQLQALNTLLYMNKSPRAGGTCPSQCWVCSPRGLGALPPCAHHSTSARLSRTRLRAFVRALKAAEL